MDASPQPSQGTSKITDDLRTLLDCPNPENLQAALAILQVSGLPEGLLSEIAAITLACTDNGLREAYKLLLQPQRWPALEPLLAPVGQWPTGTLLHAMLEAVTQSGLLDPHAFSRMAMLCDAQWMPFALPWMTKEDLRVHAMVSGSLLIGGGYFRKLPPAIAEVEGLHTLHFENAYLSEVPDGIEKINGLKNLVIKQDELRSLPSRLLELQTLEQIDLTYNEFQHWPDLLREFPCLHTINFSRNLFTALPGDLPSYPALRSFVLNGCLLEEMPSILFEMRELEHLRYVYGYNVTPMTELPAAIGRLKNLQTLSLEDHSISFLPDAMRDLVLLRELCLANTKLEALPDWLPALHLLTSLEMNGCREFRQLPETIGQLKFLKRIDLCSAQVDRLPASFADLSALEVICLPEVAFADEAATLEILAQLPSLKGISCVGYPNRDFFAQLKLRLVNVTFSSFAPPPKPRFRMVPPLIWSCGAIA
jgi:hypothetical protein